MTDKLEAKVHLTFVFFLERLNIIAKIMALEKKCCSSLNSYANGMNAGTVMCAKTFLELSTIFRNTVMGTELRDVESVNSLANAGPSSQLGIRVAW